MSADSEDPAIYRSWQPFLRGSNSVCGDDGGDGDSDLEIIILHNNLSRNVLRQKLQRISLKENKNTRFQSTVFGLLFPFYGIYRNW